MNVSDYKSRIPQWEKDKKEFEINGTIQLQTDIIHRLRKEYNCLLNQVSISIDHLKQIKSIYQSKRQSIEQEISSVLTTTELIKTKMNSNHTKAMNAIRANHNKRLHSIRLQYANELSIGKLDTEQRLLGNDLNDLDDKNVISSIGSTRAKIADLLNHKMEKEKENDTQEKLNRIMLQVDQDRKRCAYLQQKIDEMTSDLEEARKISSLHQTEIILNSPLKFDYTKMEQELLDRSADIIKEESEYKEDSENQIEQYRSQIRDIRIKSDKLKKKIKKADGKTSPELEAKLKELNDLEQEHDSILKQRQMLSNLQASIQKTKKKKKKVSEQISFHVSDLVEYKKENLALIEEIRRLDFMIYGRNGKYQKPKYTPIGSPVAKRSPNH
ncbi:hypothetical protein M9Y10_039556 [Tritrichomonas musculus]|uniref:Uncharacterized protein n=1 Tax=Tritrichomonas musculus TaxID=1915356 RepID=A0ABR2KC67_9EUKA